MDTNTIGLLGIYIIAKSNNFFFYIKETDGKLIFCLEPINTSLLAKINADISDAVY